MKGSLGAWASELHPWLLEILESSQFIRRKGPKIPNEKYIQDPVGLARLLTNALGDGSRDALHKKVISNGKVVSKNAIYNFFHGELGVRNYGAAHLAGFAPPLNLPAPMLAHFMHRRVLNTVVVKPNEYEELPPEIAKLVPPLAKYKIPPRNLADTNVTVAMLTLEPGGSIEQNKHDGTEILYCLNNSVEVFIGDNPEARITLHASEKEFVYFKSTVRHRVENLKASGHPATLLVIRHFESKPAGQSHQKSELE